MRAVQAVFLMGGLLRQFTSQVFVSQTYGEL
jgi:hypothetical protein